MNLQENLLHIMQQYPQWALVISLLISTLVALAGVVPSVFVTAANIYFFGFTEGLLISIAGESLGAAVSFLLYRYWFRKKMDAVIQRYPRAKELADARGSRAAGLVVAMRLMPMVPSGIITFAAAIGHIGAPLFITASTIGKIPALLIEAALVQGFLASSWPIQVIMTVVAIVVLVMILRSKSK